MEQVGKKWCYMQLLCLFLVPGTGKSSDTINLSDLYGLDEPFTVSELPPSCVDILDVWPTPNSILKPFMEESLFSDYVIQLLFSHPLEIQSNSVVSLSVSTTNPLYLFPYYATYFGGSERNLLAYFRIPNYLKMARKVILIIAGGTGAAKEIIRGPIQRSDKRKSGNIEWSFLTLPTIVVGEYYFSEYVETYPWLQLPRPAVFLPSYCAIGRKRKLPLPQLASLDYVNKADNASVSPTGHSLHIIEATNYQASGIGNIEIRISIPFEDRYRREYTFQLPPVITASYMKQNVSVKLPPWNLTISIAGRQYIQYNLPVSMELIHDLRERVYHSRYKSVYNISQYDNGYVRTLQNHSKNISHECFPKSKRNFGRPSLFTENVIELGSRFHRFVPEASNKWSTENLKSRDHIMEVKILQRNEFLREGFGLRFEDANKDHLILLDKALSNYNCLIPAIVDLPKSSQNVYTKSLNMDQCIFVSSSLINNKDCGGLQLYRNLSLITRTNHFCDRGFGDCIGAPLTSTKRFPIIPLYGLEELTGIVVCNDPTCSRVGSNYRQFTKDIYPEAPTEIFIPRSRILFTRKAGTSTDAVLQFMPSILYENLFITIEEFEILKPNLTLQCNGIMDQSPQRAISAAFNSILTATVNNTGKGGEDCVFTLKCSNLVKIDRVPAHIEKWIGPKAVVTVNFKISTYLASLFEEKIHKCTLTVVVFHPFSHQDLNCSHYFKSVRGLSNGFRQKVPKPIIDMRYYILPEHQLEQVPAFDLFKNSPLGMELTLVRAVTLTLEIHPFQMELVEAVHRVEISCIEEYIVIITEDNLLPGTFSPIPLQSNTTFLMEFSRNRIILFYSARKILHQQIPILCLAELVAVERFAQSKIISSLWMPLTNVDASYTLLGFLGLVYGKQDMAVLISLGVCNLLACVFWSVSLATVGVKFAVRRKLPKHEELKQVEKSFKKEKKADTKYWSNPQVYITSDGFSEALNGPHFVLHNYKTNYKLPLDEKLKSISVMGELRYMSKKMAIQFGHIKAVFVQKNGRDPLVLIQASSGMFLLKCDIVAPEYEETHRLFIRRVLLPMS